MTELSSAKPIFRYARTGMFTLFACTTLQFTLRFYLSLLQLQEDVQFSPKDDRI
jgi:hypothetical protein